MMKKSTTKRTIHSTWSNLSILKVSTNSDLYFFNFIFVNRWFSSYHDNSCVVLLLEPNQFKLKVKDFKKSALHMLIKIPWVNFKKFGSSTKSESLHELIQISSIHGGLHQTKKVHFHTILCLQFETELMPICLRATHCLVRVFLSHKASSLWDQTIILLNSILFLLKMPCSTKYFHPASLVILYL